MLSPSEVPRLAVVELTNVRGFENLRLTLAAADADSRRPPFPREQAAVVIGRNATNKSTLLRIIAIGSASRSDASAMLSVALGSFVRTATSLATIRLTYAFKSGQTVVAEKEITHRRISVLVVGTGHQTPSPPFCPVRARHGWIIHQFRGNRLAVA
jgi:hypothetical protein